jgi:hypothetical protein
METPPVIKSSWTRNLENGIQPGITSSRMRNPPEKWDSARNNQLMEEGYIGGNFSSSDSDRQDHDVGKILRTVTVTGLVDQLFQMLYTVNVNIKYYVFILPGRSAKNLVKFVL